MEDTMGYPKMIQNGHSNGDDGVIDHGILRSTFRQTDGTIISAAWTIQTSPSNSRSTPTTGRSILNLRDHREAFCLTWQPEILVDILRILTCIFTVFHIITISIFTLGYPMVSHCYHQSCITMHALGSLSECLNQVCSTTYCNQQGQQHLENSMAVPTINQQLGTTKRTNMPLSPNPAYWELLQILTFQFGFLTLIVHENWINS